MNHRFNPCLILLGGLVLLAACSETIVTAAAVERIEISASTDSLTPRGTTQLRVTPMGRGRALTGHDITFTTSDSQIATVSPQGLVTAKKPGTATITATSGGQSASVTIHVIDPCLSQSATPYALGSSRTGEISEPDCLTRGAYSDSYSLRLGSQRAIELIVTSTVLNAVLTLEESDLIPVAQNFGGSGSPKPARIRILARAGAYNVRIGSGQAVGPYTLSSGQASADVSGCQEVFITRGVSIPLRLTAADCPSAAGLFVDRLKIYLRPGLVRITVRSTEFAPGVTLRREDPAQTVATAAPNAAGTEAQITLDVTVQGFYFIDVATTQAQRTGAYTLEIGA